MNTSRLALIFSLLAAACGSDDSNDGSGGAAGTGGASGGAGGSAGATGGSAGATGGSAGATGGSAGQTVSYISKFSGLLPPDPPSKPDFQELGPMVGAKVCLRGDTTICGTTDANGEVTVKGIPASSNIAMLISHKDYGTTLLQYVTGTWDEVHGPPLLSVAGINQWLSDAGCASPLAAGKGFLYIGLPAGAATSVTGTTGAAKVVYFGTDGVLDPKLTAVPATNTKFGGAVLCDIEPGKYTVDVTGTSGACSMIEGWPSQGHALEALVDADTVTYTNWQCN